MTMKKILLTLLKLLSLAIISLFLLSLKFPSFVYAGCDPPNDYRDCPELRPDLNIDLLNPVLISGYLGLNDFWGGETDSKAPQFSTLVAGNPTPVVTSLYQLHYWDWANNQPGVLVPRPPNLGSQYDFATLVGFSTQPGQAILVPNSGYDIGQGNEVMVLFATENSLTLKYTGDDNVFVGYTLYLNNIRVDPQLLAYYNQLNAAGRNELPVLMAGMKIGEAFSSEILVAIRDTGSFMDPRWIYAWWQNLDPATILELILMGFPIGSIFAPPTLTCTPSTGGDLDSRPVPCDACNLASSFCSSCATTFTVFDTVEYKRGDGTEEEPYCVERDWGGIVSIDPSNTTIPFVGKKEQEDEQKYLADYFEGTNEYYTNFGAYFTEWINHSGVLRKLTPMEYQNKLKKEMVKRAVDTIARNVHEGGIHDYELRYVGRRCWDAPFWLDFVLTTVGKMGLPTDKIMELVHYCVFEDNALAFGLANLIPSQYRRDSSGVSDKKLTDLAGHFPPDPSEEDYVEKWKEWKESDGGKWYRLWTVVPLVSREDTPGNIMPYLGFKSKDNFTVINPDALIEKLPHVARLYEATQEVQGMLLPAWDEDLMFAQKKTQPVIASAKENILGEKILGEKTLLAQGETCQECPELSIANPGVSNGMVHYTYQLCLSCPDQGMRGDVFVGPCGGASQMHNIPPPCFSTNHPAIAPPVPISCPGTANICITFKCDGCPGCPGTWQSESCQVTVDENCEITETNCGAAIELPSVCGISGPIPVPDCEMPATTDPNENDKICGKEILIELKAQDAFENWEKPKCEAEGITCKSILDCIPTATNDCQICKNPCDEIITKEVDRRIGIDLSHPYLTKIWEQTGLVDANGLFNFFRPAEIPEFRELDAASEINYSYHGGAVPPIGRFYYNYLGGVQLAKEWVVETLMPQKEEKSLLERLLGR